MCIRDREREVVATEVEVRVAEATEAEATVAEVMAGEETGAARAEEAMEEEKEEEEKEEAAKARKSHCTRKQQSVHRRLRKSTRPVGVCSPDCRLRRSLQSTTRTTRLGEVQKHSRASLGCGTQCRTRTSGR
eukprot:4442164-Prymnesium_polylepis.1